MIKICLTVTGSLFYVAGRWRAWLGGARSRYSSWLNATHSGSCVNADEAAVVAGAVHGEELGRSRDESGDDVGVDNEGEGGLQSAHGLAEGDSSGGVGGSRFKGVSSADLAEAMRAVGSKVQRQADGGYLLEEERKFLDDGVEDGEPFLDCLLYTSDAADEGLGVDLGGRRII